MATTKKSRLKFLPPKLQLDEQSAITGSFPTVARFSIDGRTGNYKVSFDDTKTLLFKSYNNIEYGVGLPSGSLYFSNNANLRQNQTSTQFSGSGNLVKGIGDSTPMVRFNNGQDGGPFRDNDQYAVDGKSDSDPFFATGTSIADGGEGFESPLWSKNKIEIDISCGSTSNFSTYMERNNTPLVDLSYNMCYYNFNAKRWEGIGIGRWLDSGNINFVNTYNTIGFLGGLFDLPAAAAPSVRNLNLVDKYFEYQKNAGRISDIYGFPFDARYHATSSQLFSMSQVINKPFLVEKIVIDISASFIFDNNIQNGVYPPSTQYELTSSFFPGVINNIFLLNQRKNVKINYYNENYAQSNRGVVTSSLPRRVRLSNISEPETTVSTIRDIITYGGVSTFASNVKTFVTRSSDAFLGTIPYRAENPKQLFSRDIVIDTGVPLSKSLNALNWNQRLEFKLKPKCPSYLTASLLDGESRTVLGAASGGSNNLGVLFPSGRNQSSFIKNVKSVEEITGTRFVIGDYDSNTPYILYPEDNLILGWQQPSPSILDDWYDITTGIGTAGSVPGSGRLCRISFAQGPAKLVLYGSYITEGKEDNDSLNQLLSSESIHEIIGED